MIILADAGVPMLLVVEPVLVLALIPIILIEALFFRGVACIPFRRALLGSLWANLTSTLAGVPATWIALVILQMVTGGSSAHGAGWKAVTWQSPWLIPYENELWWMVPIAAICLNVPFFLVSLGIEFLFARRCFSDVNRRLVVRACWMGNIATYGGLTALWLIVLISTTRTNV